MKIGLIDVDSHNFPNLALMKVSAYHKARGDHVEWWQGGLVRYDQVYVSRVFDDTYSKWEDPIINAEVVHYGGTGFNLTSTLPDEIEHQYPDYSLYPQYPDAYGFLTRGCTRNCPFCIVGEKESLVSRQVADISEFWRGQDRIKLLDPNLLACKDHEDILQQLAQVPADIDITQGLDARLITRDNISLLKKLKAKRFHFAWDQEKDSGPVLAGLNRLVRYGISPWRITVYALTNFNTEFDFDRERVDTLIRMGMTPYVMIYNKPSAPQNIRDLQSWCNNPKIRGSCKFEDYNRRTG